MAIPRFMNKGSLGPVPEQLQAWLKERYQDPELTADGDYGDRTAANVGKVQAEAHQKKDGHCGPNTRGALKSRGFDFKAIAMATSEITRFRQPDDYDIYWSPEMEKIPNFMCPGSEGVGVQLLQGFLANNGFGAEIVNNGIFDDVTKAGIIAYMNAKDPAPEHEPTGKCGPKTRDLFARDGFHFGAALLSAGGKTSFVQPDGQIIEWSPTMKAEVIEDDAGIQIERADTVEDEPVGERPLTMAAAAPIPDATTRYVERADTVELKD